MEQRFFICEHCGNMIAMVKDKGVPVMCCGQKMTEIIPGTTDAAVEKHVPAVTVEGSLVKNGEFDKIRQLTAEAAALAAEARKRA